MEIKKVEKKNYVDEVYKQIQMMIFSGKWKEGERLASENQLGEEFSVSRVVIREALQRLRAEKLIVTRQGVGSFVSNPYNFMAIDNYGVKKNDSTIYLTEAGFKHFLEFRRCFEYPAIKLAVIRATEENFQQMQDSVDKLKQYIGNIDDYTVADYMFHYALVCSSHNPYLIGAMTCCREMICNTFYEMNKLPDCHQWGVEMHEQILDCLRQRDAQAAILLLKEKNNYNYARLSEFFAQDDQKAE
jgi:GntR family transcriptional repressor for pyruvate dehydrogenase complex